MHIGRNDLCPCGSGKKYKKCCLRSGQFEGAAKPQRVSDEQQLAAARASLKVGDIAHARRSLEPLLSRATVPAGIWAFACQIEMGAKDFTKARDCMARALELEPGKPSYLYNYGTVLALSGEQEKAVDALRRAVAIDPGLWMANFNLGNTLRDLGRSSEAVDCYRAAFDADSISLSVMSQIVLSMQLFTTDEHALLFALHRRLGSEIAARNPAVSPRRDKIPEREKIRLGYVSPRFSREIVGYFFKPLFDHHDRSKFEIYLYSATPRADDLTAYFADRADKWVDIGKLADTAMCQQIVDDEIDILIDLAGHTPESRITAIARKPAPVQVSMLDYFDTTGVEAMDFFVTDKFSTPPDAPQKFTEELLCLNRPRLVYEAPDDAPDVSVRQPDRGGLVFGSFNRHHKIVPHVIETWSQLLCAVPDSRLVLKSAKFSSKDVQGSFLQHFHTFGIADSRIEFRGSSPYQSMLAEYGDIDIALDTFPYNGGLTSCEALWMGTPVMTLLGQRIISRQTACMLNAVGLPEFVANSEDEFAEIGKYWAAHRVELNGLRDQLRARMAASPLTDASAYAAEFEQNLQRIWHQYLSGHQA